jgi:molybdate transport system substrate-binding protein
VYSTDARSAGAKVSVVQLPAGDSLVTKYPIAVVKDAQENGRGAAARAFVDVVLSPQGQEIFEKAGFGKP